MKVYQSTPSARVHFDPECTARSRTHTDRYPLRELELLELRSVQFCRTCSPEDLKTLLKKRPVTNHDPCDLCNWRRPMPCEHNGGVAVISRETGLRLIDGSDSRINIQWRWPENVLGAPLAHPLPVV